ncbi:unnamed protein product [Trypanosoma congolense IL3000]|uniref:Peptidyl-prolyl cis-trans isomerase n=1 Tax=Trypanosoma congolense (strain IL3000) TaxID=1068625 RepID=F9W364_TRYCI|nr:unnamed protein product [Trypanosoma congolense IL3000]
MEKGMEVGGAEMLVCDGADAHAVEKDCLSEGRPDKKIETEGELGHTADQGMTNPTEDELDTFDEVGVETAVAAAAAEEHGSVVQRHLYHVLIKHKDVARPTSLAPRNKGERVTRSKADAIALAQAILARHQGDSTWSLEEFIDVVQNFSECGSAKRKGDLGMVESGTYTESFDAAAFSLKCGEVSKPVETELGVHLIYRVE